MTGFFDSLQAAPPPGSGFFMPMQHKKFPPRCTAGWEHTAEYSVFVCLLKTHSALRKLVPKGQQPRLEAQQHGHRRTKGGPQGVQQNGGGTDHGIVQIQVPAGHGDTCYPPSAADKSSAQLPWEPRTVWRYAECFSCRFRFRPWPFPSWRRRTDRHRCRPPLPGRSRRTRRRGSSCPGRPGP